MITIGDGIPLPSHTCLYANAHALARYAALCQEASIVPMIEPEVLLDGGHTIERCEEVTEATLRATYAAMAAHNVSFEHLILKTSMVVSGKANARQAGVDEVAERTLRVLKRTVPAAQPGVVFLSGGQSDVVGDRAPERDGGDEGPALAADVLVFARAAESGAQRLEGPERQRRRGAARVPPPRAHERARGARASGSRSWKSRPPDGAVSNPVDLKQPAAHRHAARCATSTPSTATR